jgi:hypothetical protein
LATLDPDSALIHVFRNGQFERYRPEMPAIPVVGASVDWYRGWRDHLGFASIVAGAAPGPARTRIVR